MERDWSAAEFRRWNSQELDVGGGTAALFPVHKEKWTLSDSVMRKVTSPRQFLSSPSDFWLLFIFLNEASYKYLPINDFLM